MKEMEKNITKDVMTIAAGNKTSKDRNVCFHLAFFINPRDR